MSVSRCPFRFRRRFALIIAMMAWVTSTERSVLGQSGTDPKTIATPDEPTTSPFAFPPLERKPIRLSVPEIALPLEIAARRSEIERKSLERIFSGGMIVAWAPQETVFPKLPSQFNMIDAGILDQPPSLSKQPLVSDRIQELPKPVNIPMIETPQPMLPLETLPGMIEDDSAMPVIIGVPPRFQQGLIDGGMLQSVDAQVLDPSQDGQPSLPHPTSNLPIESPYLIESERPTEMLLPNYALPGGGLDVFQLAPSLFGRPLPNAR